MKSLKSLKWTLLFIELAMFFGIYFFGSNGAKKINNLKDQEIKIKKEISELEQEVSKLEIYFNQLKTEPYKSFYKEKIAREQLQLLKDDEELFIIKS